MRLRVGLDDEGEVLQVLGSEFAGVERDASPAQAAIAWVMAQQEKSVIVPVLGARSREQLTGNLGALDLELTAQDVMRLNEVSRVDVGFPHDFYGRDLPYGDTYDSIDAHRAHIWPAL